MKSEQLRFCGADNLSIMADCWGNAASPPVILLHGGGQTRHAWGDTAQRLAAAGWYAVAIDLRGHGDSQWHPDGDYSLPGFAADVASLLQQFEQQPVLIGASLGGLSSLFSQLLPKAPAFRALVLVDVTPKLDQNGVSKIVGFMQEKALDGFASLEEAADAIAGYLPHRKRPDDLSGLSKNLRLKNDRYFWHWDPAFMVGDTPPNSFAYEPQLIEAAKALTVPTLLVRGRMSDLVTMEAVEHFMGVVPHAQFVDVKEAGHMIAGDKNDIFGEVVIDFLATL